MVRLSTLPWALRAAPPSACTTLRTLSTHPVAVSTDPALEVSDRSGIRWLTLRRPARFNALTLRDLSDIQAAVSDTRGIHAIALHGEGKATCAGMDTRQFAGLDRSSAREVIAKVGATLKAFRTAPVPTAILVEGYLLGAGFEMALAADFRVAVRGAKVGLPETKVGIPSVVDAALLQNYVGLSLAKEMVLIGDIYPVEDLPGFVNRYAEPGQLVEVAEKLLAPLAEYTPVVMKAQKELNEMWLNTGLQDSVERSIDVFADVFVDPSTSEAVHKYNARKKK